MLGGSCSKCCGGLKCYVPASTHGACCKLDGTCSIEAECDCDTDSGEAFRVGEGCEACTHCTIPRSSIVGSQIELTILSVSVKSPRLGFSVASFGGCSDADIESQFNAVQPKTFLYSFADFRELGVEVGTSPYWGGELPGDLSSLFDYSVNPFFYHVCESAGGWPNDSVSARAYSNKLPELGCVSLPPDNVDSRFDFQLTPTSVANVMGRLVNGELVHISDTNGTLSGSLYNHFTGAGIGRLRAGIRVDITATIRMLQNPLP